MRILLTWILKRAHIVYVRESQSAQLLQQLGIVHHRAPDFVWGIPTPTPLPATAIHPTLGITVMDYGQQTGQAQHQHSYETCIIAVARHFHAAGWSIHLFAQCTDDAPGWDDRVVVQRLASHLPFAHIMPVAPSPHVLQQQYAELSCLLSTRLHGALMRFAMNQPAVVIAYHPKAHGIMHDIGLEAWCLAIDTLTPEAVIHAVDTAATQLPIIAAQRQQQVDTLHTLTIPPTAPAG
jgi:polysaccharide pyruvyl transferase WcaK-like protein